MQLSHHVNTFGRYMHQRYGERVHKISINAGFVCPNLDGSKGTGGCTFCNNSSFNPQSRQNLVIDQIMAGKTVIKKRTGAKKYLAYFQAYTNTYDDIAVLKARYDQALADPDVIGLSIGTRPDCVPQPVLELLLEYQQQGFDIWLELGLQSSFDETLRKVNRGHGYGEYKDAVKRARSMGLRVCTHLIVGLPGETTRHNMITLKRVLRLGTDGLKIHPLHVVKGTEMARQWRKGEIPVLDQQDYVNTVVEMIRNVPEHIVFHRLTGTAEPDLLLAPEWCAHKWRVLNDIAKQLEDSSWN